MSYRETWNLSTSEFKSEHERRNRAMQTHSPNQKLQPCRFCGKQLNATQRRKPCPDCGHKEPR